MQNRSLLLLGIAVLFALSLFPADTNCQTNFAGSWTWQSRPNSKHESTQFSLDIKQKAGRVSGQMWFGMLVDGENDGADSSSIPFVGTVVGNRATIEFDPNDIHSIDEENVRYKRSRSPSTAVLELKNGKLVWTESTGSLNNLGLGPLRNFSMSRQ